MTVAVRRAATTVPGHAGNLDAVLHRYRRRHRRRAVASAATGAVLVGVVAGTVPLLAHRDRPTAAPAASFASSSAPGHSARPAQRLVLTGGGYTTKAENGPEVGLVGVRGVGEVGPDGSVLVHQVSGLDGWYQAVILPDGRLVVLGYQDLMPGVPREDGPGVEGLSIRLEVLTPDGPVERSREVRVVGQYVGLVAATADTAYLVRPNGLVAHDLATGAERTVLDQATIGVDLTEAPAARMDLAAGRLAVLTGRPAHPCALRVLDVATGRLVADLPLATLPCAEAATPRLSPDGSHLALSYLGIDHAARVAVVDVATGSARTVWAAAASRPSDGAAGRLTRKAVKGMAWGDATTLRLAWAALPAGANRVYRIDEVLRVETVRAAP